MAKKPVVLIIIDGFGLTAEEEGNAFALAKTPNLDYLLAHYPHTQLKPYGRYAGIEPGQAISAETGYQQIGTGSIAEQPLKTVTKAIQKGEFFRNTALIDLIKYVKEKKTSLHFVGMLSDGGIQSEMEHLFALLELAQHHFLKKIYMHLILDGRDVENTSARKYLRQLDKFLERITTGTVATIIGRHYAMPKAKNAKPFKKTYDMLTKGKGTLIRDPMEAVHSAYRKRLSDEFVEPTVINQSGLIKDKTAVVFFNARTARNDNLVKALSGQKHQATKNGLVKPHFVSLIGYEHDPFTSAFTLTPSKHTLAGLLAEKKKKQLAITEEEKSQAATFFFNGNRQEPYTGETWKILASPGVETYDKKPTMATAATANAAVEAIRKNSYDFIRVSFAAVDAVAHTGKLNETIKAIESVDAAIGKIVKVMERKKAVCIITSTHGNAETMVDRFGRPVTQNSCNPVPFIITKKGLKLKPGRLVDVAPTVLRFLRLKPSSAMKGKSLVKK